jgi:hypothetical protein
MIYAPLAFVAMMLLALVICECAFAYIRNMPK